MDTSSLDMKSIELQLDKYQLSLSKIQSIDNVDGKVKINDGYSIYYFSYDNDKLYLSSVYDLNGNVLANEEICLVFYKLLNNRNILESELKYIRSILPKGLQNDMKNFSYEGYNEEDGTLNFMLTTNYSFHVHFIGNVMDGFIPKVECSIPFSYMFGDSTIDDVKVNNNKMYCTVGDKYLVLDIDNRVLDILDMDENSTIDCLAMYSNKAMFNNLYGGFEGDLYNNFDKYILDTHIKEIIKKYKPKQVYSFDDMEMLFYDFYKEGSGFVAGANAIFSGTMSLSDVEFDEKFGYPRYRVEIIDNTLIKVCNYDYLSLDLYFRYKTGYDVVSSVVGKNKNNNNNDSKGSLLNKGVVLDKGVMGSNLSELVPCIMKFLSDKGIKNDGSVANYEVPSYLKDNLIDESLKEGKKVLASIYGFYLYYPLDVDKNGKFDDFYKSNFGGHIVEIIEPVGDGRYVIASWGKKYLLNISKSDSNIVLGIVSELLSVNNTYLTNLAILEF